MFPSQTKSEYSLWAPFHFCYTGNRCILKAFVYNLLLLPFQTFMISSYQQKSNKFVHGNKDWALLWKYCLLLSSNPLMPYSFSNKYISIIWLEHHSHWFSSELLLLGQTIDCCVRMLQTLTQQRMAAPHKLVIQCTSFSHPAFIRNKSCASQPGLDSRHLWLVMRGWVITVLIFSKTFLLWSFCNIK